MSSVGHLQGVPHKKTARFASGKVWHGRYPCAFCDAVMWTRYGFRAHMLDVHRYRSSTHAIYPKGGQA